MDKSGILFYSVLCHDLIVLIEIYQLFYCYYESFRTRSKHIYKRKDSGTIFW